MEVENQFTKVASLIGDKVRSVILWSLLDGKAYTATELSTFSNSSRQSVSNHLSKLIEAELISVEKQGRHRYFRLANEQVAQVIESLASLIPNHKMEIKKNKEAQKLASARTCYDHLAGKLSIEIKNALVKQELIILTDNIYEITDKGNNWFKKFGINIADLKLKKRSFAHPCLDWTEREHHIAGALGTAILEICLKNDWIRRKQNSREIIITALGEKKLQEELKISTSKFAPDISTRVVGKRFL